MYIRDNLNRYIHIHIFITTVKNNPLSQSTYSLFKKNNTNSEVDLPETNI